MVMTPLNMARFFFAIHNDLVIPLMTASIFILYNVLVSQLFKVLPLSCSTLSWVGIDLDLEIKNKIRCLHSLLSVIPIIPESQDA